jgi:hypothetical protein
MRSTPYPIIIIVVNRQSSATVVLRYVYFLRKEQPSVNRALPPVGWHLSLH